MNPPAAFKEPAVSIKARQYGDLLRRYMGPQLPFVITLGVLLFIVLALQLVLPQIIRYFIDEAQKDSPIDRLTVAAVIFIGVAVAQQFIQVFATYFSEKVGWTATNNIRDDLATHALSLDMSYHNDRTPGEMIERIDGDANELGGFFSTFVINLLGNAVLLVGILALLFREDWRAGLALIGFTALMVIILVRMRHISIAHWKKERDASTDTFGFIEEQLSGREDIRTNAAKSYVDRRFRELMRTWFRAELKAGLMTGIVFNTNGFMFRTGSAIALGVGAYLFLSDLITIGSVFLIFHYTSLLGTPIQSMTRQLNDLQKATASLVRIHELLQTSRTVLDGPGLQVLRRRGVGAVRSRFVPILEGRSGAPGRHVRS